MTGRASVRDEDYAERELPAYGAPAQPAVAARMGPELRKVSLGTGLAALALVVSLLAVWRFPEFAAADSGRDWAITLAGSALAMLAVCGFQLGSWRTALAAWEGRRRVDIRRLSARSWLAHLLSYVSAVVALVAAVAGSAAAGWSAISAVLMVLALVLLGAAQVLAGVQYVRASGPPGTVPAHMSRLLAREDRRTGRV
jgi:hypothetical protein